MPRDKFKRAISVALSLSMLISAPQIGSANLVPINGILVPSSTPPPPCQTVIAPNDAAVGFSMKSFEAKISKALKPSNNVETEKMKRKTVKAEDASGSCSDDGSVTYSFIAETGTLTISGTGAMSSYSFWSSAPWYSYRESITSVNIEDGVTSIGNYAFDGCSGLTSITIPDSVTSIGSNAFSYCSGLNSITIPDSVTSIRSSAFYGCSGLNSITIPDSVTSIGDYAFYGCSGLNSITIPDRVTSIGSSAFRVCSGLTSIKVSKNNSNYASDDGILYNKDFTSVLAIPGGITGEVTLHNSLTSIGDYAFYVCSGLTSITIPDSVTSIGSNAFSYCSGLKSITIPDRVTSIGNDAFNSCGGLTSVVIGNGVTSIGDSAFRFCNDLTSVTIPDSVTSIGNYAFDGCSGLTSIKVSENNSNYASYDGILYSKDFTSIVAVPGGITGEVTLHEGLTTIGYDAFRGCSGLTSIKVSENNSNYASYDGILYSKDFTSIVAVPGGITGEVTLHNSLTSIGDYAFYVCSGLRSITIPDSVTSIGNYAFYDCSGLRSIELNNDYAVSNFKNSFPTENIKSVTLGKNVKTVPNDTFTACNSLTEVKLNSNAAVSAFKSAFPYSGITSITLGNDVTTIPEGAFSGCARLTSITIPKGVTSVGNGAFVTCDKLTSVTLNSNASVVAFKNAFSTDKITSVTLGKSVNNVDGAAFAGCPAIEAFTVEEGNANYSSNEDGILFSKDGTTLVRYPEGKITAETTTYVIPDSVTTIGPSAFSGCGGLTSVTIPASVTSVGNGAFVTCDKLTSVTLNSNASVVAFKNAFSTDKITSVTLGKSVNNVDGAAFAGCSVLKTFAVEEENANYSSNDGILFSKDETTLVRYPEGKITAEATTYVIPDSVTTIGSSAFSGCSGLTSVTIPDSVTSIGNSAFNGCGELAFVNYAGTTEPRYDGEVFRDCNKLAEVRVPFKYTGDTFCGKPVNKAANPDTPSGGSKAGVIAGSVVAAVAVVAAVVVTAVMYVKKLACFARLADSVSEGGAPAEEV